MKSFIPKKVTNSAKVGDIISAMSSSGEFGGLSHSQIEEIVHIFLREFVGLPSSDSGVPSIITRKFTHDEAVALSLRLQIPIEDIVKVIAVFRVKASPGGGVNSKMVRIFTKSKVKGGVKHGVTRKL